MNIELEKINNDKRDMLYKLVQLYLHDLSLDFSLAFDSEVCEYHYNLDKYFKTGYAYFIKDSTNIVGFILINYYVDTYELNELFVLNNYKRKGIGEIVVKKTFDEFRGNWVIKAVPNSIRAENFWTKTINNYTNGNYELKYMGDHKRPVFSFKNKE
jgi:predicted acetyltransferase